MWCLIWTNQTLKWKSYFNPLHIVRSKQMTCWSSWYLGSERTYHKCIESIIRNTPEISNIEQLSTAIALIQFFYNKGDHRIFMKKDKGKKTKWMASTNLVDIGHASKLSNCKDWLHVSRAARSLIKVKMSILDNEVLCEIY